MKATASRNTTPSLPLTLRKRAASNIPWRWAVIDRTLAVALPQPWLVLSWAPLRGGFTRANLIVNHQVELGERAATEAPQAHLRKIVRMLRCDPRSAGALGCAVNSIGAKTTADAVGAVGMMTGAKVARVGYTKLEREGLAIGAWTTAGCSNALRVGDRATVGVPRVVETKTRRAQTLEPGTINIIVAISQPLSRSAMAEALQIAVEARVAAVQKAGVRSVLSGAVATGTGTDCIAVAAPIALLSDRPNTIIYCGKHTLPGELIGRAVMRSCGTALARALG
jgi:adenosylcobinamide amidohydrolase